MDFHHVGVATRDAADLAALYADLLDAPVVHEQRFQEMDVVFLDCGNSYLELLEPLDGGTIASYLDDHGPGMHHLAFETADLSAALDRARSAGVDLVDEEPRPGAWDHEVAFLHPASTGGVLVEFVG